MIGKLNVCLYGTRDAAVGWQRCLTEHLLSIGFEVGVGHPSVFVHRNRGICTLVHGDDDFSFGNLGDLRWLDGQLRRRFEVKTQIAGDSSKDESLSEEIKMLNRVVRWTVAGFEYEVDPRHAEIIIEQLGVGSAAAARPCSTTSPTLCMSLFNCAESRDCVIMSLGFSVPATFESPTRRSRSASWIHKLCVSRWRILPSPLRCAMPMAALASTHKWGDTARPKSLAIACAPSPSDAPCAIAYS